MPLIAASSGVHRQVMHTYLCDRARCGASKVSRDRFVRLARWAHVERSSINIMTISLANDKSLTRWVAVVFMLCVVAPAIGQSDLPDAPMAQSGDAQASQSEPQSQQTSRILGIIPNFRAVSSTERLPAQTVRQKFVTATQDSLDYSALFVPTVLAGINLARKNTPEFGTGAAGYGQYWWHAALDQTSENYMVEFVVPALTHQDTRYYTLGHGGFFKRTGYALSRAAVTRTDAGNEAFNVSEVLGAGMSAGLSNAYYPARERTVGNTMGQWALNVGIDAGTFWFKEFWPDINKKLFHGK
jgi:hypothetical protein